MNNSEKLYLLYWVDREAYYTVRDNYPHLVSDPENAYPHEKYMFNAIVNSCTQDIALRKELRM